MKNTLRSQKIALEPCLIIEDPALLAERYRDYLHDESKFSVPTVSSIAFPKSEAELVDAVHKRVAAAESFAISSSRTGLTGACVPAGSQHLISLDKLKGICELEVLESGLEAVIRLKAGTTLEELNSYLYEKHYEWFFPVDPTEWAASLGGMFATNASGARTYHYSSIRKWVNSARIVLANAELIDLRRGECLVEKGSLQLVSSDAEERALCSIDIPKPRTKNTLGYEFHEGMDALDLFIGSEGTLGLVSELELRLIPRPKSRLYNLQFFNQEQQMFAFVEALRKEEALKIFAIESFDKTAFSLIRQSAIANSNRCAQMLRDDFLAGVYVEIDLPSEDDLQTIYERLSELLLEIGADIEQSIAGFEDKDAREMKAFRHAVPEKINALIAQRKKDCPSLHKIATDMAVEDKDLRHIYYFYKEQLDRAGLEYCIFGHIGDNHFHVNIMPRDERELKLAKDIYLVFAKEVVRLNGAVSAEHGIGRIKRDFLKLQYGEEVVEQMRKIKEFFDPLGLISPGVLFTEEQEGV